MTATLQAGCSRAETKVQLWIFLCPFASLESMAITHRASPRRLGFGHSAQSLTAAKQSSLSRYVAASLEVPMFPKHLSSGVSSAKESSNAPSCREQKQLRSQDQCAPPPQLFQYKAAIRRDHSSSKDSPQGHGEMHLLECPAKACHDHTGCTVLHH